MIKKERGVDFPKVAPCANPVFFRTYSRRTESGAREIWKEVCVRTIDGLVKLGGISKEDAELLLEYQSKVYITTSGRWLWVGGTSFVDKPSGYYSAYNCSNRPIRSWADFVIAMDLLMQGVGFGAVVEESVIAELPTITNRINLSVTGEYGDIEPGSPNTEIVNDVLYVGDSREGWYNTLSILLESSTKGEDVDLTIDVSHVRRAGTPIKGFGGKAKPELLKPFFVRVVNILNKAVGRKLTSMEVCLILGEIGKLVVSGNIRRSAEILQGTPSDINFTTAKDGLWKQDADGNWIVDPERDALRMGNHTAVYHYKPTYEEVLASVTKQFYSGEGAIQYAPEAIARANADLFPSREEQLDFISIYDEDQSLASDYIKHLIRDKYKGDKEGLEKEVNHRLNRYALNPCFRGDMRLLTSEGYKTFEELDGTEPEIISLDGSTSKGKVWYSGEKEIVELKLTNRESIFCTPDHRFLVNGAEVEAKDTKGKALTPFLQKPKLNLKMTLLGFVQGDGQLSQYTYSTRIVINVGKKDSDIINLLESLNLSYEWTSDGRRVVVEGIKQSLSSLQFKEAILPERTLPTTYNSWSIEDKTSFLSGLYSANGSVIKSTGRISFKTTCLELANELLETLEEDFGIHAYITTNKTKAVAFANGVYQCKESYDVNIQSYRDRLTFFNSIGFYIEYKSIDCAEALIFGAPVVRHIVPAGVDKVYDFSEPNNNWGVVEGYIAHNCGEIIGTNFLCDLSQVHLELLDPHDFNQQKEAFRLAAISAAVLLKHQFVDDEYRYSREVDPIVGVSFTGLFDFFVNYFGERWLEWWMAGRPQEWGNDVTYAYNITPYEDNEVTSKEGEYFLKKEQYLLNMWRETVEKAVEEYCTKEGLNIPNRATTCQPSGSKSLLSGGASGWHPPKSQFYIRRITMSKYDPVAMACIDYGYTIVPSQSDKDENGNLLTDPFDERVTEWLVEIPVQCPWVSNVNGEYDIEKAPLSSQWSLCMQVQKYYVRHNTSATLEFTEEEIPLMASYIYNAIQQDEGYVSAALLPKFDAPFPRLPFEKITRKVYNNLMEGVEGRRGNETFEELLAIYDNPGDDLQGPAACEGFLCQIKK